MSGVAVRQRQRHRHNVRPHGRHTKAHYAESMRAAAFSCLRLPGMDQEGIDNANAMLEMVGEMLTPPRAGWYPKRPAGWKP